MQIQIRAAMAQDYEAAVKILSQVQDMHVEWRPDIYRHTSHLMSMEEFQQAAEGHTFFVAENEKNQVIGILQIMFKHVEGPAHTTRDFIFVDRMAVDEAYRGAGVGHKMFDFLKGLKAEKIWTPLSCRSMQKIRRRMKCIENTVLQKNPSIWSCWNHKKHGFRVNNSRRGRSMTDLPLSFLFP